jgi:hypothetical protein
LPEDFWPPTHSMGNRGCSRLQPLRKNATFQ